MTAYELLNRYFPRPPHPYYVVYVSKEDGKEGQGYYCKTLEEAQETKRRMEGMWGAEILDVIIRDIRNKDKHDCGNETT